MNQLVIYLVNYLMVLSVKQCGQEFFKKLFTVVMYIELKKTGKAVKFMKTHFVTF